MNRKRKPLWLKVLLGLVLAGVVTFGALFGAVLYGSHDHIRGDPQVMVILGCQVKSWGPRCSFRTGWTRPWTIWRTTRT